MQLPPLQKLFQAIDKLSKKAKIAAKAVEKGSPLAEKALESASQAAREADCENVAVAIAEQAEKLKAERQNLLGGRRELLLQKARDAGLEVRRYENSDRIDVLELAYNGLSVELTLGGTKLKTVNEPDGERLWQEISKLRLQIMNAPFDRDSFFSMVKAAWHSARRIAGGGEYQLVRDVHRELVLERARRSPKFFKSPEPKNIEPYPMAQFVYDLARFGSGNEGWVCGTERLQSQSPAMRESRDSVHVPQLNHPLKADQPMARLTVAAA